MALLHDLLYRLEEDQIKQLSFLHLATREKQVLDFSLAKRRSKSFPSALAMKQLNLTQSHLEKICSVVMKKIILHLAGTDAYDQFLLVRNLPEKPHALILHQMRLSEKQIRDPAVLREFYIKCCDVVTRTDTKHINMDSIRYYTARMLHLLDPGEHPEQYIRIQCDALYAAISLATMDMSLYDPKVIAALERKVEKLERDARALNHPMSLHHALRISAMFFICTNQQLKAVESMDDDIKVTTENRHLFTDKEWAEPQLMKAEALSYAGRYEQAYKIFEGLLMPANKKPNIRLSSQSRFFKVALTLGKYNVARELIDAHFLEASEKSDADVRVMCHLQIMCYYMHMGQLDEAAKHIVACRELLHKHRQQQYLIQLLFFENAMAYLRGHPENAKLLAMKNLKFLRSRKMTRSTSTYPALFSSVSAVYDLQYLDKPFTKKQQKDFDTCTTNSYSHFAGIFLRMLSMKRIPNPPRIKVTEADMV